EDRDLGAADALGRERVGVAAARLWREKHAEAAVAAVGGAGAREQRHQVGARTVGDPGLRPEDAVLVAVLDRAGLQAGEVRSRIGLGENRGRDDLAGGDAGEPFLLLPRGAAEADQL